MSDLSLILWAQEHATPALTAFFTTITSLGSLEFYMLAIPIIYWIMDKHFGFRFSIFFIVSAYLNSAAKHIFQTERPPRDIRLVTQEGYSFPSGHAQGSTVFWGFLALKQKASWAYALSALMILLISFSRIYLGVHWPIDILGGVSIGVVLLALYARFSHGNLESIPLHTWIIGSTILALLLYWLHPTGDGPMAVGFMLGALIGYRLELLYVQFEEKGTLFQNISKLVLGVALLFLLRIILKPLVSPLPHGLATIIRYGFLGLWATLGAPYLFVKLGLSKQANPKLNSQKVRM